jgi:hypothetical protein
MKKIMSKYGFWIWVVLMAISIVHLSSCSKKMSPTIVVTDTFYKSVDRVVRDTTVELFPDPYFVTDTIENCPDTPQKTLTTKGGKVTYQIKDNKIRIDCNADSVKVILAGALVTLTDREKTIKNDVTVINGLMKTIQDKDKQIDKLRSRKDMYKHLSLILLGLMLLLFIIYKLTK